MQTALAQELGTAAQLQWQSDGSARITLRGASAPALARWLAQVRSQSHAAPEHMRLVRSSAEAGAPPLRWDGELVLRLAAAAP